MPERIIGIALLIGFVLPLFLAGVIDTWRVLLR